MACHWGAFAFACICDRICCLTELISPFSTSRHAFVVDVTAGALCNDFIPGRDHGYRSCACLAERFHRALHPHSLLLRVDRIVSQGVLGDKTRGDVNNTKGAKLYLIDKELIIHVLTLRVL